jgi:hypothetical protein
MLLCNLYPNHYTSQYAASVNTRAQSSCEGQSVSEDRKWSRNNFIFLDCKLRYLALLHTLELHDALWQPKHSQSLVSPSTRNYGESRFKGILWLLSFSKIRISLYPPTKTESCDKSKKRANFIFSPTSCVFEIY